MNDWTSGYVADIDYTYGYYQELNPARANLPLLSKGIKSPKIHNACELGFGQGLSANIHAAASPINWYGTDFNPAQAGFAQELAMVSGAGAQLFDEAFADFSARTDLPDFDFIGLHGIWSWISDDNRRVIVDFVRRKLKVGGILYISYNTLPGWAAFAPMRYLMTQHAQIIGSQGQGIVSRIDGAMEFAEQLLKTEPLFTSNNPMVAKRLEDISAKSRHYLAHEYFNEDWNPMHVSQMAQWLQPAKLDYACSANFIDHNDAINLTDTQSQLLNNISNVMLRESTKDFMVNEHFRRDYWVKGTRKLSPLEQTEAIQQQKLLLIAPRESISLKVKGARGEANMNDAIYNPILDLLENLEVTSIGELQNQLEAKKISLPLITEAVMILSALGAVAVVQDEAGLAGITQQTDKLNDHLIHKARSGSEISHLASPITSSGIPTNRFQQLFVGAMKQGKKAPDEIAQWVWAILKRQDQRLLVEGKALETDEANIAELTKQATEFIEKQLPILKVLKVF
jgi:SAM-dependent methyltransferase